MKGQSPSELVELIGLVQSDIKNYAIAKINYYQSKYIFFPNVNNQILKNNWTLINTYRPGSTHSKYRINLHLEYESKFYRQSQIINKSIYIDLCFCAALNSAKQGAECENLTGQRDGGVVFELNPAIKLQHVDYLICYQNQMAITRWYDTVAPLSTQHIRDCEFDSHREISISLQSFLTYITTF